MGGQSQVNTLCCSRQSSFHNSPSERKLSYQALLWNPRLPSQLLLVPLSALPPGPTTPLLAVPLVLFVEV